MKYFYLIKNEKVDGLNELEIEDSHHFQLIIIPDLNNKRDCIYVYVAAQSGAGKSYFCTQYLKEYIKMHPKNPIYLFSYLDED
jgi:hypothetical protein